MAIDDRAKLENIRSRHFPAKCGNYAYSELSADIALNRRAAASTTSSVTTVKFFSHVVPNEVVIATSAASRPVAISTRPIRGLLLRASNVHQRSSR